MPLLLLDKLYALSAMDEVPGHAVKFTNLLIDFIFLGVALIWVFRD